MLLRDMMTAKVEDIPADATLMQAAETMKRLNIGAIPVHGDDDQIVPIADSAPLSAKLLKNAVLKVYPKFPHGMCTTNADVINADLLALFQR
jgi:non-heme chloroperoxidase